ncbi:ATP-binding cassette domain-containing protein [Cryobacterium sp. TMT2-18-3]|uniref:ABC transporter ATP-binding protein n=1 Tax=unclassified Cryobacterium TaxID=2649013 RepID=UPI00106CE4E0|nr:MULTISPECIES: ATP-binding cassette domain-containing protein [unclassified Cryobacterium]TFC30341.1 ATP-binding cassette domain-containing protein [Cryobacterium sp. TMT2-18-2]TFC66800.1 ATP-binding cassette domain-containing protein [Cryobacterium sp. TMT2-18-3]
MIQAQSLTKRHGGKTAVDAIDFTVQPGKVTGLLGPNGAGKSTIMRMIVGLDRPTAGSVTVNGKHYSEHRAPLCEVGVLLDARAVHTGRTARNHLLALAVTHGIPAARVDEVIELTGIGAVARTRVGRFSLGMGQRLGIAAALLGDPAVLILDEPVNGLDPEGVQWVRQLMRHLAVEGRTVLLSSHMMSEMALTADHLIMLGRGKLIANAPVSEIIGMAGTHRVRVRTPQSAQLAALLAQPDVTVTTGEQDLLEVAGISAGDIGEQAAAAGIVLHELTGVSASLEEAYLALTQDEVEYRASGSAQLQEAGR